MRRISRSEELSLLYRYLDEEVEPVPVERWPDVESRHGSHGIHWVGYPNEGAYVEHPVAKCVRVFEMRGNMMREDLRRSARRPGPLELGVSTPAPRPVEGI